MSTSSPSAAMPVTITDSIYMARALALAERGRGRTSPNPMVGAVIVDDEGVIVGQGSHAFAGGPHAEIIALRAAADRARGATLYCTLEPCSHTGRTGPCAPAVASAGIRRVVVATADPNPLVAGQGLAYLRDSGIDVGVGVHADVAERLNAPFFTVMRHGRPFVTMKAAVSRDNCVAVCRGARTQLTGSAANRLIHRERAEVDAIAIGSGTLLADDPVLTPRGAYRRRPLVRVVFDRSLRMPVSARLLATLEIGPIIVVTADPLGPAARLKSEALTGAGAEVWTIARDDDRGFLTRALARLARRGVQSVVLEGGPTVHAAAWAENVVDRVQLFRTPWVLGPSGVPWLNGDTFSLDWLVNRTRTALGDDVLIEGYVHRAD